MKQRRFCVIRSRGSIAPFVMGEMASALKALGHEVLDLDLEACGVYGAATPARQGECARAVVERVAAFAPDWTCAYGLAGKIECPGAQGRVQDLLARFPAVLLFYDSPLTCLDDLRRYAAAGNTRAACWDRSYLPDLAAAGFPGALHLPLATNPDVFAPGREPVDFPVSFVGGVGPHDPGPVAGSPALQEFARRYLDLKLERPAAPYGELLDAVVSALPPAARQGFEPFRASAGFARFLFDLWGRADARYRGAALHRACGQGPAHVWGPETWRDYIGGEATYHGPAGYGAQLASIYGRSAVVLNFTASHLREAVNQRVFDGAGCEAFVLGDWRAELDTLFEPGVEIDSFRTLDEMEAKLRLYLDDAPRRHSLARRARRRVLAEHTWRHRAARLCAWLEA